MDLWDLMIDTNRTIFTKDDFDEVGMSLPTTKKLFVNLQRAPGGMGFRNNEAKTKWMIASKSSSRRISVGQCLIIDEYNIEVVGSFVYLGSLITC